MDIRVKAAWLSVLSNTFLMISKIIIGIIIGSVSVISEAIHSANDLLASFIAVFAVRTSTKPPDEKHPYGHGKIENISGTIEALLIFIAAILIIYKAVNKILHGGEMIDTGWGIAVMGVSALCNYLVSNYLLHVGRQTESIALEADGMHLRTDVYTSLGVFLGLILIKITGWRVIDPLAAILVAGLICKAAYELTRKAFAPLLDTSLDESRIKDVETIIEEYSGNYLEYHDLRTRRSGRDTHIDLHLVLRNDLNIQEAHDLCDRIEERIHSAIPNSYVLIHVEPASPEFQKS